MPRQRQHSRNYGNVPTADHRNQTIEDVVIGVARRSEEKVVDGPHTGCEHLIDVDPVLLVKYWNDINAGNRCAQSDGCSGISENGPSSLSPIAARDR